MHIVQVGIGAWICRSYDELCRGRLEAGRSSGEAQKYHSTAWGCVLERPKEAALNNFGRCGGGAPPRGGCVMEGRASRWRLTGGGFRLSSAGGIIRGPKEWRGSTWAAASRREGELGRWYVSIVSIFFDCLMPILYNFYIFLATFYMIYSTNLLI